MVVRGPGVGAGGSEWHPPAADHPSGLHGLL